MSKKAPDVAAQYAARQAKPRPLSTIAREIREDWGDKIYFGAVPYLAAMSELNRISEPYSEDSGESIVLYFLNNAGTWRGETARRIKAELRGMV